MRYYKMLLCGLLVGCLACSVQESYAAGKKKKKEQAAADTVKKAPKPTAFDKLFKDKKGVVHRSGVLSVHKAEDKVYLEIPFGLFGRDLLVDTYVSHTSDVGVLAPGRKVAPGKRIRLDRTDSLVLFRLPTFNARAEADEAAIERALRTSRIAAVTKAFPIEARNNDSTAVVIDATSFFQGDNPDILNLQGVSVSDLAFIYESEYLSARSQISGVEAFGNSICVSSEAGLRLTLAVPMGVLADKPEVSVGLVTSLTLLPEDRMRPREADPRIGTAYVRYDAFGSKGRREGYFAGRWRLEPKDPGAVGRGELSEPVEPIVVYVDTLFSENWAAAIRKGIEAWNPALEQAGFRRAIRVEPYPSDSTFRADDPLVSRVVCSSAPGSAVALNRLSDPRTGQILSIRLTVPRDIADAVRKESIYTISNVDRRYAGYFISDEAICEVLAAKVMQKMGLGLGLATNLAGSAAYTTEQMRDPEFTRQYGFTASVTDDVLFNLAARPGDRERGVATIVERPGIYDLFAVKWLYTPLGEDERTTLSRWLDEKTGDSRFFYGKQNGVSYAIDPRAQKADLGSDLAGGIASNIENLKFVIAEAPAWLRDDRIPESYKELFPDFAFLKVYDHIRALSGFIGGIYQDEPRAGRVEPTNRPVPKAVQRQALREILTLCEDLTWLDANREFLHLGGPNATISAFGYSNMPMQTLFFRMGRMALSVEKSDDPYTQEELLNDLADFIFRDSRRGWPLTPSRTIFAGQYVAFLIQGSPVMKANLKKAKNKNKAFAGDSDDLFADSSIDAFADNEASQRIESIRLRAAGGDAAIPDDLNAASVEAMQPTAAVYYYVPKNLEPMLFVKIKSLRRDIAQAMNCARTPTDRRALGYYLTQIDMALTGK